MCERDEGIGFVYFHHFSVCDDWIAFWCVDFESVGNEDCLRQTAR